MYEHQIGEISKALSTSEIGKLALASTCGGVSCHSQSVECFGTYSTPASPFRAVIFLLGAVLLP